MKKLAVFASGSGSNYEVLMQYFYTDTNSSSHPSTEVFQREYHFEKDVEVALVVTDQPNAYVIERAKKWETPTFVISPKDFVSKAEYEQAILEELERNQVEFIVLAGYMRLIGPTLLQAFKGRMVNIHPSLLPAFPGKNAIGQAFAYGVKLTGITIHFIDEGMDTGPIIYQEAVEIEINDTEESLIEKIQAVEHQCYPQIVEACLNGEIVMEERKVQWAQKLKEH